MKFRKRLPSLNFKKPKWLKLNKKGQSLVEFVLLLAVISGISYGFVSIMNRNIGYYWQYAVNLVVFDDPSAKQIEID